MPRHPPPVDNRWYDDLGDGWWDPRGPVAALHELNPVRVDYFTEVLRRELTEADRPRVLDLGCGGSLVTEALAERGCEVLGLDASLPSLRTAQRHSHHGRHLLRGPRTRRATPRGCRSQAAPWTRSSRRTCSSTPTTSLRCCARSRGCCGRAGCCCSTRPPAADRRGWR